MKQHKKLQNRRKKLLATVPQNIVEHLTLARDIIKPEKYWIKGKLYSMRDGEQAFCSIGAIHEAVKKIDGTDRERQTKIEKALKFLTKEVPVNYNQSIARFNDAFTTTHTAVMALFERAIEAAKKQCGSDQ